MGLAESNIIHDKLMQKIQEEMDSTILEISKASELNTIKTQSDESADLEIDLDVEMLENKEAIPARRTKEFKIKKSKVSERESKIIERFYSEDSLEDTMVFETPPPPEKDCLTAQWN